MLSSPLGAWVTPEANWGLMWALVHGPLAPETLSPPSAAHRTNSATVQIQLSVGPTGPGPYSPLTLPQYFSSKHLVAPVACKLFLLLLFLRTLLGTDLELDALGFQFSHSHLAVWPWGGHFTSLSF